MESNNLTDKIEILFQPAGNPISPNKISQAIESFPYSEAIVKTIRDSKELDEGGKVFTRCATLILTNFKMTRGGPFLGEKNQRKNLDRIWKDIGGHFIEIRNSLKETGLLRDRLITDLDPTDREKLIDRIWLLTKLLLPITMGKTSYGLVGASKILFAVFPELVLPIDNRQWLHVFKTVDLGDVLRRMVSDIQHWESATGTKLNELGSSKGFTTLPSVYNIMAMKARP
jgi:hypothetical protein